MEVYMRYFALILISVFLFSACGSNESLAGTWVCKEHYIENMVNRLQIELNKDGTAKMSVGNASGTYEVKDDKVVLKVNMFGSDTEIVLQKENGKLVSSGPMGRIVYEKQ